MPKIVTPVGIIKYQTYPLYIGIKRIDKDQAKENLQIFDDIAKRNSLFFGLIGGTLLGAIREDDFITHDEDIDLFVLKEDKDIFLNMLPMLLDHGFKIARYDRRGLISVIRNEEYIDVYLFSKFTDNIRICSGWCIPERFLLDTIYIDFQEIKVLIPKDYLMYLEYEYGENWKIPIAYTDFKVNQVQKYMFILKDKLKDMLPDILYLKLAEKNAKKMRKKYLDKILFYL